MSLRDGSLRWLLLSLSLAPQRSVLCFLGSLWRRRWSPTQAERRKAARRVAAVFLWAGVLYLRRMSWLGQHGHRGMPWRRFPDIPDMLPGVAACPPELVGWSVHASRRLVGFRIPVSFPVFPCRFIRGHPLRGTTGPGLVKDLPAQSARSSWTSS